MPAARQLATDNSSSTSRRADNEKCRRRGLGDPPPPHWLDPRKPSRRTSRIVEPADGRIPPQTPEGQKRIADRNAARALARSGRGPSDSYVDRSLYDRCITRGLPGSMMPAIYGNSYQIVQGPGWVGIRYEMIHEIRMIPLDKRPHAASKIRTYMGDARGHWEGNTLVSDRNFAGQYLSERQSDTMKLVGASRRWQQAQGSVTVDDTVGHPRTFEIDRPTSDSTGARVCVHGATAMTNISRRADGRGWPRTVRDTGGERRVRKNTTFNRRARRDFKSAFSAVDGLFHSVAGLVGRVEARYAGDTSGIPRR